MRVFTVAAKRKKAVAEARERALSHLDLARTIFVKLIGRIQLAQGAKIPTGIDISAFVDRSFDLADRFISKSEEYVKMTERAAGSRFDHENNLPRVKGYYE